MDIGGQDSKVICLDESGGVTNFVMNDKCAAGTGRFLELMARTLELSLEEMALVGLHWEQELTISSMCTVFAESEVVSLIADNHSAADIVHGLNQSVAAKTAALASRAGAKGPYMMTGGVARNRGVTEALEARLGAPLWLPPEPDLCGALGARPLRSGQHTIKGRGPQTAGRGSRYIRLFPPAGVADELDELDHQGGQEGQQDDLAQVGKAEGGATIKRLLSPGVKSTSSRSTTPARKARTEYLLVDSFSRKMDSEPRQLKPWNRRARVRVAKAMVEAITASPPW